MAKTKTGLTLNDYKKNLAKGSKDFIDNVGKGLTGPFRNLVDKKKTPKANRK